MPPLSVLTVCVGNVCRSPMAERLLSARLAERDVGDRVVVGSAGVRALVGSGMHPQSAADTRALGGSTSGFRARQATPPMLRECDLVLTATQEVRALTLEEEPSVLRRTFTLREFAVLAAGAAPGLDPAELIADCAARLPTLTRGQHDVPDPYNAPLAVFAEAARLIDEATASIADSLARALPADLSA